MIENGHVINVLRDASHGGLGSDRCQGILYAYTCTGGSGDLPKKRYNTLTLRFVTRLSQAAIEQ